MYVGRFFTRKGGGEIVPLIQRISKLSFLIKNQNVLFQIHEKLQVDLQHDDYLLVVVNESPTLAN